MIRKVIAVFGVCVFLASAYTILRPQIIGKGNEGFEDISGATKTGSSTKSVPCNEIPLSAFNTKLVLSLIPPDIQYAISTYSVGGAQPNYLNKLKSIYKTSDTTVQMAMSALLARYLAFNGGSAGIPGPGYTKTSPGNYLAQVSGAKELLTPDNINTKAAVYPSFKAATDVAFCPKLNKDWVSTADF